MNDTAAQTPKNSPPRLIPTLTAGFNVVATNIYLIVLPVLLDLLLWFGPHFRLKALLNPAIQDMLNSMNTVGGAESVNMLTSVRELWQVILERFNLLSLLSSLPIGVPSLVTGISPLKNPLGQPLLIEIRSFGQAFSGMLLFALLGLVIGSLYFSAVARRTASPVEKFSFGLIIWQAGQAVLLALMLLLLILALSVPITLVSSILALISPAIAELALLIMTFVLFWLFIPLIFSPHGIYVNRQNALRSMLRSTRIVRFAFPSVALFLLSAVVLSQGMGYLWRAAPESSWMMVIGIFGSAFISTSLLAASFIFYQSMNVWVDQFRQQQGVLTKIQL